MPNHRTDSPPIDHRPCVGIMLINEAGLLFIGERRGMTGKNWQMPQGGIDDGEQPIDAAKRELFEETGVTKVEFLAESSAWYCYQIPKERRPGYWKNRYVGQCQRWFAFRFTGRDADVDLDLHEPEFSLWRWAPSNEVLNSVVPFKHQVYASVIDEFRSLLLPSS